MKNNDALKLEIQEALASDPDVNIELLDVKVAQGTVTLSGNVSSDSEKWKADDIAQRVAGVVSVISDLQVAGKLADPRSADAARPWFPSGG